MFEITKDLSWKVREKRARNMLTKTCAANEIGIARKTLLKVEKGVEETISKTVYEKIINWLLE